jgi:UDP-N-acetylmuramoylalanine--D-glutamate ligase
MSIKQLANQKILILGLGAEGWSTYRFLRQQLPKAQLTLADQRPLDQLALHEQETLSQDRGLTFLLGGDYLKSLANFDLIFKAPGIPQSRPEIKDALAKGAQLSSNTQLFFELCQGQIIGVTGTKGKSTTASVIHHVLKEHGLKTILVGNIGQPALDFLPEITADTLVVFELSSHQLETLTISPHIGVVQNVTSEHLDYYATTEEYRAAKSAITRFQTQRDSVIFDPAYEGAAAIAAISTGQHLRHSLDEGPEAVAFVRGDAIVSRGTDGQVQEVLPVNQLPLLGRHNLHNVLPAVIIGELFNIDPAEIGQSLKTFQPLPHRLELVTGLGNVRYYNDSLATIPDATISALENFDQPVVLIAGGYERHQDFTQLATVILEKNVVGLVLFRPTGERLAEAVKQAAGPHDALPEIKFVATMAEAVQEAQTLMTAEGGVVLMSPASASFGLFKDYRDRGEQFKAAVQKLMAQ